MAFVSEDGIIDYSNIDTQVTQHHSVSGNDDYDVDNINNWQRWCYDQGPTGDSISLG